jgi:succinate dehydrogenase / fumarate reductase, membrane anchor subunit
MSQEGPNQGASHMRSYTRSRKSGAPGWMLQRITGIALIVLTIGHYIWMHYNPASGHDFSHTAERLKQPVFVGMYILFVVTGMYHGIQGMWNIIRDFKLRKSITWTLYGIMITLAIIFVGIGINTVLTFDPNMP